MAKSKKKLTFEDALEKLEDISARLESGSIPLDESIVLFEEGMNLSKFCREELERAEGTIQLLSRNANGQLELVTWEK